MEGDFGKVTVRSQAEHWAHQAKDSIRENTEYVKKSLKDQNWASGRCKK